MISKCYCQWQLYEARTRHNTGTTLGQEHGRASDIPAVVNRDRYLETREIETRLDLAYQQEPA